jgi:hypothetical protein
MGPCIHTTIPREIRSAEDLLSWGLRQRMSEAAGGRIAAAP